MTGWEMLQQEIDKLKGRIEKLEKHIHRTDYDKLKRFTTPPLDNHNRHEGSYEAGYNDGLHYALARMQERLSETKGYE